MDITNDISIDEENFDDLVVAAKDASFFAGAHFFRSNDKADSNFDESTYLSFTMFPSPFPRKQFDLAYLMQPYWNILINSVSNDHNFLYESLKSSIESDKFVEKLWNVYEKVYNEGFLQKITVSCIRCDYMLDMDKFEANENVCLSQVELNTLACGGCAYPRYLQKLHKYMLRITDNVNFIDKQPNNECAYNVANSIVKGWKLYGNSNSKVLLVVRDRKENIPDHRLIEYKTLSLEPSIKIKRIKFNQIYNRCRLDENRKLFIDNDEIGLVYYKAGFMPSEYATEKEWDARLMIERSLAIKAPNIQHHLCGLKMVQQALTVPGAIEQFIKDEYVANLLRATFVQQYCLANQDQNLIKKILEEPENYVLKPQREGGGNNLFGSDIRDFYLKLEDKSILGSYVLMKRIRCPSHKNYLMFPKKPVTKQNVSTELGVFGVLIATTNNEILFNKTAGYLLRSKIAASNECGVMSGYGLYDSVYFVD